MADYTRELNKLADGLYERNIPFEYKRCCGGYQIVTERWDAVCHPYSYGGDAGLLEVMGSVVNKSIVDDDVEGWLTAEDILARV